MCQECRMLHCLAGLCGLRGHSKLQNELIFPPTSTDPHRYQFSTLGDNVHFGVGHYSPVINVYGEIFGFVEGRRGSWDGDTVH